MAISGSLNFLTASEVGSYLSSGNRTWFTDPGRDTGVEGFIPVDFVGLNTNVYEPISSSVNILGHGFTVPLMGFSGDHDEPQYINRAHVTHYLGGTDDVGETDAIPRVFNSIMLNRNGPYGYPMWKQTRGSEHPLSRHYRSNNLISIDQNNPVPTMLENASSLEVGYKASEHKLAYVIGYQKQLRSAGYNKFALSGSDGEPESSPELSRTYTNNVSLKQYYEPVVTTKHKPITYAKKIENQSAIARQSLMNQMVFFSNPELNSTLRISSGDSSTGSAVGEAPFKTLKHEYYSLFHAARSLGAYNFIYAERMYPRDINTYRGYKLKRPNYEENTSAGSLTVYDPDGGTKTWSGGKIYDKKPGEKRSFWRTTGWPANEFGLQSGSVAATSDGTNRLRTDGAARISISGVSKLWGVTVEDTAIKKNSVSSDNHAAGIPGEVDGEGAGLLNNSFSRTLLSGSTNDCGSDTVWNDTQKIIANGILNRKENVLTGTLTTEGLPTIAPYSSFVQHETYQPYEITALSMWPLDPRQDIYDKPIYLTSSIGGHGLQIGLTPHRASIREADSAEKEASGTPAPHDWPTPSWPSSQEAITGSILQLKTGSAGELVYSTKPTLFFYRTGSLDGATSDLSFIAKLDLEGYGVGKASIQYNRHTFPYNTPFYATNKIRGIDPFHNSYEDFFGELKHMGRDYSIVPEYNLSEHLTDHYQQNAPLDLVLLREQNVFTFKEVKYDPLSPTKRLFLPRTEAWYGMPAFSYKPENHKANFLSVPGAIQDASSSAQNDFVQTTDAGTLYKYLDVADPEDTNSLSDVTTTSSYGIYGNSFANHWARDRQTVKFSALFGETDNFKSFSNLLDQKFQGFKDGIYTIPAGIKFKCRAIKKMRIKDGFYPVTRTVQIAKEFDEAFLYNAGGNPSRSLWYLKTSALKSYDVTNTRTIAAMCKQAFLEPLFAPGILYNSIKSGIAVDWPLYGSDNLNNANPPSYYCPTAFLTNSCDPGTFTAGGTNDRVKAAASASFNYGGLHMMGSSRCFPAILTETPSHRLPFNALFDFKDGATDVLANRNVFLPSDFVDLDRNENPLHPTKPAPWGGHAHPGVSGMAGSPAAILTLPIAAANSSHPATMAKTFYSELNVITRNIKAMNYHSSINNYLCETMEFYLADAKQSTDKETPGIKFPVIIPDYGTELPIEEREVLREKKLFMEIGLSMGLDQVMCEGPRRAGIPATSSVPGVTPSQAPGITKFGNTMRGYIYGPPVEIVAPNASAGTPAAYASIVQGDATDTGGVNSMSVSGSILATNDHQSYFYFNLQDPAYQAYTPPYFYGESSKILSYTPLNTTDNYKDIWEIATLGIDSEFNAASQGGSFYYERYDTGSFPGDTEALCLNLPNTSSISSGSATRMKIDASLEFSNAIPIVRTLDNSNIEGYTSYITPWWTCPVLDFSSSYSAIREVSSHTGSSGIYQGKPIPIINTVSNIYHDMNSGRGMWGGYGTDPYDQTAIAVVNAAEGLAGDNAETSKGVYITVRNIFADSQSEYEDTVGYVGSISETPIDGFFTSTTLHTLGSTNTQTSASLAEKLGFKVDTYPVGAIAPNKRVSEAIVIIPYIEEPVTLRTKAKTGTFVEGFNIESVLDGHVQPPELTESDLSFPDGEIYSTREIIPGKHFLPINKTLFNNILSLLLTQKYIPAHKRGGPGSDENYNIMNAQNQASFNSSIFSCLKTDVGRMIKNLIGDLEPHSNDSGDTVNYTHNLGYQLPPEFDFIHNSSVNPFQMLIIPFEHVFGKQDLVDMYQGIMPRIARFFEKASKELSVRPNGNTPPQPMGGPGDIGGIPSWMPYIPISAMSAEASYYKNLFDHEINIALADVSSSEILGHGFIDDEEGFLDMMRVFKSGQEKGYTAGTAAYRSLFQDHGLSKNLADDQRLQELQKIYDSYTSRLKAQISVAQQTHSPSMLGEASIQKQTLENLGLENFLCPPLMSQLPLTDHPLVQTFCDMNNSTIPEWTSKEFYENIRFMVFKVKQRAAKDYKKYRKRQIHQILRKEHIKGSTGAQVKIPGENVLENITFGEVYGSNWPYDYFSLLETIKIDVEFRVTQ